jgi:hypothetical protein
MRVPVAAIVLLVARTSLAGICGDLAFAREDLKKLEAFAKLTGKQKPPEHLHEWLCVENAVGSDALLDGDTGKFDAKATRAIEKRAIAACTKVLDRDGDSGECVLILAEGGLTKAGDHDIFAAVGRLHDDPIESDGGEGADRTALYGRMKDPRAAKLIVESWRATIPRAEKREKRHGSMSDWSGWRQSAAGVLAQLGGADEQAFLEEQAKATIDVHVAQACRDGAAAIGKRIAKP